MVPLEVALQVDVEGGTQDLVVLMAVGVMVVVGVQDECVKVELLLLWQEQIILLLKIAIPYLAQLLAINKSVVSWPFHWVNY